MAAQNKMGFVLCRLAVCNVLVAVAAQAPRVSFEGARNFSAGNRPYSVAVGDFNGDGAQDLAVANQNSTDVSVLLGNGDGTFQPARSFDAGGFASSVAVGDFNGDGRLDLAVARSPNNVVAVLFSDGGRIIVVLRSGVGASRRCVVAD